MADEGCICHGNWRLIIEECEPLFDSIYADEEGSRYQFVGILWASDDFYYVMRPAGRGTTRLLTCVGSIENQGFKRVPAGDSDR